MAIREGIFAVAAAEDAFYLVCTVHCDLRGWHGSGVATAIDVFDAGKGASVDDDFGIPFVAHRLVCRQVAAAIDGFQLVAVVVGQRTVQLPKGCADMGRTVADGLIDVDQGCAFGCAVQVVAAEDVAQHYAIVGCGVFVELHERIAYESLHVGRCPEEAALLPQAAIDVAFDDAAFQVDCCCGRRRCLVSIQVCVAVCECSSAIDVAHDVGGAGDAERHVARHRAERAEVLVGVDPFAVFVFGEGAGVAAELRPCIGLGGRRQADGVGTDFSVVVWCYLEVGLLHHFDCWHGG